MVKINIKTQLLKNYIADYITQNIDDFEICADKIADSTAINILSEIQDILKSKNPDEYEMIERIVQLFEKYHLETGGCHDY